MPKSSTNNPATKNLLENTLSFDAVIVGAGGAGLRAALQLAESGHKIAVVSKVFPTRSHTVAAQGGINAALGNVTPDNWQWHMYDTIKGSDYLGDQDAIEYMCQEAAEIVRELEHFGVPFSRLENGKIYQRAFGGQSQNYGEDQAHRTCAAADRTGHAILHSLYQQNIRLGTTIFEEFYAIDLLKDTQGAINGIMVMNIHNSEYQILKSPNILLATGGAGQVFRTNTNAGINTGDGLGMVLRAGYTLQDMEFWQFHPTGVAGKGMLISEAARGEGGVLRNASGEAFMEKYAPHVKDLASRDVVSRAIAVEVQQGRGCGPNKDHVLLDLTHLDGEVIKNRLPGIRDISITFAGIDPIEQAVPVFPTCHYMMGGIPTNLKGQVITPNQDNSQQVVKGLYAVGECACVSVHGANRLGGNSLLDIVVFGRKAAQTISEQIALSPANHQAELDTASLQQVMERIERWHNAVDNSVDNLVDNSINNSEDHNKPPISDSVALIKKDLQKIMEQGCGVFREESSMRHALQQLPFIEKRLQTVCLTDDSDIFNLERLSALELENLLAIAFATANSALARQESRGAHSRIDYQQRDDQAWLKHTLYNHQTRSLSYKEVNLNPISREPFTPKKREY
ncbi:succinate dehydrogenase flavoprotein subunit [Thiomicrorhabdus immobilis]|uniref:Succinate dehydrogenase flavoprotein subunit n=1 Tax=Thiomicrorhabdus immobilis TaxID=2791037 RepID=A0ABM7MD36_9GAMM|nr:succinate dehydrogenase flavoprotein subunit [Thiomicrorhabdus immobilis]BCN93270.1 succinate dehydrogenase flavoprotein subunit [Thiomicrorhabdus immobilis]